MTHSLPVNRWTAPLAGSLLAIGALVALSSPAPVTPSPALLPAGGMQLVEVSTGFGQVLPYRAFALDASGQPTSATIALDSLAKINANVTAQNPIQPPGSWPSSAVLPNGAPGNHFLSIAFNSPLEVDSVLSAALGGLSGAIQLTATDQLTQVTSPIKGRAFIDGFTFAGTPSGSPPVLQWQQWVQLDSAGKAVALTPEALGFPGTESAVPFAGLPTLFGPHTLVFVRDEDGDLSTHESFPAGQTIGIRITDGVQSQAAEQLTEVAFATTTIGTDAVPPAVATGPLPLALPSIEPGNGETNVDYLENIVVEFTEPIQPLSLAGLPGGALPLLSAAVQVEFGPPTKTVAVPVFVQPLSPFDLSRFELLPAFAFPGAGPDPSGCGDFNRIRITLPMGGATDLAGLGLQAGVSSFYSTGRGPGLVNAPVAPDAVYVARFGAGLGLSVIDLNGNGQSTGNPAYDPAQPMIEGNSQFPNNPNVSLQGSLMVPPLAPGSCTVDGGSAGVFTLTKSSNLNSILAASPLFESVGDFMLGHALDSSYNNGPPPFGCQAGGGNLCATTGLKDPNPVLIGSTHVPVPAMPGQFGSPLIGAENLISWAPHPNPPPLVFPPLCVSPYIGGQEPTSIDTGGSPQFPTGLVNLLVPGPLPQGIPSQQVPPQGLLAQEQNAFFVGPSSPATQVAACQKYQIRQQIGHFLYVVDRVRREVVVLNSNRFTVIDRIAVVDPVSLAMSPGLEYLAVTSGRAGTVELIDIDPASASFHQIVKSIKVGRGPAGIAWEPDNEDILCCNELDGTVSIISAFSLQVRKTVSNFLSAPFEVAITPRQMGFGFNRQAYFAYILNRDGTLALFESGPDGIGGWGADDVLGLAPGIFTSPKAMQPDPRLVNSGVWVVHERSLDSAGQIQGAVGTGAVTQVRLNSLSSGPLALTGGAQSLATRNLQLVIGTSLGDSQLSGVPVDLAFDNLRNLGGLQSPPLSPFAAGGSVLVNGKNLVRQAFASITNTSAPASMFLAIAGTSSSAGVVDVIDLGTATRRDVNLYQPGVQSIPAAGARLVMDYFRQ